MRTATDATPFDERDKAQTFRESMRDPAFVAITILNDLPAGGDNEISHKKADDTLLEYLDAIQGCGHKISGQGPEDVARAYREARDRCVFWYA